MNEHTPGFGPAAPERSSLRALGFVLLLATSMLAGSPIAARSNAETQPDRAPDLQTQWLEKGSATAEGSTVRGRVGETVRLPYRVRNVGGSEAYAVLVSAHTALGVLGQTERLQPGPGAGASTELVLTFELALGMRELCLEARLQTLASDDPQDPDPRDNRCCRRILVDNSPDRAPSSERSFRPWSATDLGCRAFAGALLDGRAPLDRSVSGRHLRTLDPTHPSLEATTCTDTRLQS